MSLEILWLKKPEDDLNKNTLNKKVRYLLEIRSPTKKFEKIIHTEEIENRNRRINELIKIKNQEIKLNKKFLNNQFKIQLKHK